MPHILRSRFTISLFCLTAVATIFAVSYVANNSERYELDDRARAGLPGSYVQLSQGITRYEMLGPGTGPVVILVHGFSVPMHIWNGTFERLANAGLQMVRFDLFGRGYSDRPDVPYDVELFDKQLVELISRLKLPTPVDLVSISMGAQVAARFAGRHRELVRRVVLIAPTGVTPAETKSLIELLQLAPGVAEYLFVLGSEERALGQLGDFADLRAVPEGYVADYHAQMQYRGFRNAILSTLRHSATDGPSVYEKLGASGLPVAVIWGTRDTVAPFENHKQLLKRLNPTIFVAVEGAGHVPHIEQPDLVTQQLIRFLRSEQTVEIKRSI